MSEATRSEAFASPRREHEADVLGMWVFIGSEALLFGAIMLAYLVLRLNYPETFAEASKHLKLLFGSINTAVLLTSSLTMALAVAFLDLQRQRLAVSMLAVTALLGTLFLGIKGYEYWTEIQEGLAPLLGIEFRYPGPDPQHAKLFFSLYFAMTGLHALHLLSGILVVAGVLALWPLTMPESHVRRVLSVGLYWHFVDIVWVFLFPILYLIDR